MVQVGASLRRDFCHLHISVEACQTPNPGAICPTLRSHMLLPISQIARADTKLAVIRRVAIQLIPLRILSW